MNFVSFSTLPHTFLLSGLFLAGCAAPPATPPAFGQDNPPAPAKVGNTTDNEGGDLAFGGPGVEAGKFLELRDMTFKPKALLYSHAFNILSYSKAAKLLFNFIGNLV